ncbi:Putative serine/threonine-protein kinase, active [Septoria linicola]|uniref:non-specific serine/threonine protein kinase n=1 Tax=Septoria linicola TaxID=215465 RepID=A0A9Q9EEB7_9PEZI|nr:putative serine/threonine-protein kinase, active [Septoria linicola]USW47715.1 Putative serine/threonine-protein kinase, active [Septoria linicola]
MDNPPRPKPLDDIPTVFNDDFDDGQSTQLTQETLDPRRLGLNHSGIHAEDVADVICILHPSTPAAYQLTQQYSRLKPQFCLQYRDIDPDAPEPDPHATFILDEEEAARQGQAPLDLTFRFSNRTRQQQLGLTFGRNPESCDIAITRDQNRRISNTHFCIHLNETGVLMIKDLSTNGTMVDDMLLKGRTSHHPHSRMLTQGSVIQVLTPTHGEIIKFIVRFPTRDGHYPAYENAMQNYLIRQAEIVRQWRISKGLPVGPPDFTPRRHTTFTALMPNTQYGMRWNGGDIYNVVGYIGKGAFASVYQLATKLDGHLFAAKELEKRRFMKNGILDHKLDNEMQIMRCISHPSVVEYKSVMELDEYLYIIMEYVPCGDLQQYISQHGPVPENMAKQVAQQVLDALDYLHKKNITHRDIKPDNILLKSTDPDNVIIKLSDFGLSKAINSNDTFLKTFCGTLLYCAPEVFPHYDTHSTQRGVKRSREPRAHRKFHSYSHAVDIWSFGAVLWYTLCHKPPFDGIADATGRGMFDNIMHTPLDVTELIKHDVSDAAIDLLVRMLDTDPLARLSAEDCLRHPWFGLEEPPTRPYELELHDIQEEEDQDVVAGAQEHVASLSLNERVAAAAVSARGLHQDEVSLSESDLNFFDPRKSKKVKVTDDKDDEQDELVDSSPDLLESIPIMNDAHPHGQGQAQAHGHQNSLDATRPPKLFGEISQSDLQSPATGRYSQVVGQRNADSNESLVEVPRDTPNSLTESLAEVLSSQSGDALHSAFNTNSLLGTESMVRELDIESPFLPSSFDDNYDENNRTRPSTPEAAESIEESSVQAPEEAPPPERVFRRRIVLPLSASYYYDPADPSTHNAEYASRVSGHDFVNEPDYYPREPPPLPVSNGALRDSAAVSHPSDEAQLAPANGATHEALRSAEAQCDTKKGDPVGRLVSTKDSFANVVVELDSRKNTFGRDKNCTTSYENKEDTRVGKYAFTIFLHATGIENIPEGEEHLDMLPGAYIGILTHSSNGVTVNGERLCRAEAPGKQTYGKLHHGDIIEVWPRMKDQKGLSFRAEIYQGEGKKRRPRDAVKFEVEMESPYSSPFAHSRDYALDVPPSNQDAIA